MVLQGYDQIAGKEDGPRVTVSYGSVNGLPSHVELDSTYSSPPQRRTLPILLGFAALLLTGVAVIGYASSSHGRQNLPPPSVQDTLRSPGLPTLGAQVTSPDTDAPTISPNVTAPFKCRNCTMTECKAAMCDASVAPFACLSGFAKGGCAKLAKAWDNPGCDDCCDTAGCASLAAACGKCTPDECLRFEATCGKTQPYVCTLGPSNGGCSDQIDMWPPMALTGVCEHCCNLNTCAPPTSCKDCTETECIQVGAGCFNTTRPFACSAGPALGGCADKESVWQDAYLHNICTGCCNTASCKF